MAELDLETFAVFDPRRQLIFELNETSRWIWTRLSRGFTPPEVRTELSALTGSMGTASRYVDAALDEWLASGWLRPSCEAPPKPGSGTLTLAGVDVPLRISSAGGDPFAGSAWIEPLWSGAPDGLAPMVELWRTGSWWTLRSRWSETTVPASQLPPAMKAVVVEALIRQPAKGFFVHAGLLELSSGAALIMGGPGAGKSTLCGAAVEAGATCWSDDVTRVHDDGRFQGVPFPLTLKEGSRALLPDMFRPDRTHGRPDGQMVHYAHERVTPMASPTGLSRIYFLDRRHECTTAVERVPAVYALRRLIEDGHAFDHRLDPEHLRRLTLVVNAADCFRLSYADAREAAALMMGR